MLVGVIVMMVSVIVLLSRVSFLMLMMVLWLLAVLNVSMDIDFLLLSLLINDFSQML
jgi:hypothetical protein